MTVKKWTFIDKSTWADGPWQREPDKLQWIDQKTGFPCLVVRNSSGALGGYVGVSEKNPFFQKNSIFVWIHGGLSYKDFSQKDNEQGICYISESQQSQSIWWFGFTCDRPGDIRPAKNDFYGEYRDIAFVIQEVESLAQQIQEVSCRASASSLALAVSNF